MLQARRCDRAQCCIEEEWTTLAKHPGIFTITITITIGSILERVGGWRGWGLRVDPPLDHSVLRVLPPERPPLSDLDPPLDHSVLRVLPQERRPLSDVGPPWITVTEGENLFATLTGQPTGQPGGPPARHRLRRRAPCYRPSVVTGPNAV